MSETPNNLSGGAPSGAGMQSLIRMLHILFFCMRILIILVFAYLLFSGIFRVDEQNEAMLFRFGSLQSRVLDPEKGETNVLTSGRWYWAWPYPIDKVKEIPAQKSVTVSTENIFRPWINPSGVNQQEDAQQIPALRPGADGYLLTGDTNILHAKWSVTYRIEHAADYYLNFYDDSETVVKPGEKKPRDRGAEAIIRNLLANAAISECATWKVEEMIATTRTLENGEVQNIKDMVQKRLEQLLEEVGIGVQIQSVSLVELLPPAATMEAFREVNASSERGRSEILAAKTYSDKVILEAEGNKYRIVNEAKSYETRIVETVKADSSYFETVLSEYNRNPDTMLTALYTDALRQILASVKNKYVVHKLPDGRQELRMQLSPIPEKDKPAQPPHGN